MSQTNVFLLPDLIAADNIINDSLCVVIDVLRATTTIVNALGNQAASITPVVTVEEARKVAAGTGSLLGGERNCKRLEGFDFGNSPAEYTQSRVANKEITLTTTNGTRALMACLGAEQILIAAFTNLTAVANAIAGHPKVNIVCAGTNGEITLEDALLAGALASGTDIRFVGSRFIPFAGKDGINVINDNPYQVCHRNHSNLLIFRKPGQLAFDHSQAFTIYL